MVVVLLRVDAIGIAPLERGTVIVGQMPGRRTFPGRKVAVKPIIRIARRPVALVPHPSVMDSQDMAGTSIVTEMAWAVSDRHGITYEQELWAMALWVEKNHGPEGPRFIAEQVGRFALEGDEGGVALWHQVAERFDALQRTEMPHGAC